MIVDPQLRITIDDVRREGFCPSGTRDWFKAHDLDFRAFLRDGIDAETFLSFGDSLAQRVVMRKIARENNDG